MTKESFEKPKWSDLALGDLIFFLRLLEVRSLTEAAKDEGISLSTASRVLKKLRDILGDPLFLRSSPLLIATQRALELEPDVRSLAHAAQALEKPEVFSPADLDRCFRIGVVDNAVFAVMKGLFATFFAAAPKASIDFVQMDEDLFEKLASGEMDCAVYPSSRTLPKGVHEMPLFRVGYALCLRPNHPAYLKWKKEGEIPWADVKSCRKVQVSNHGKSRYEIYSLDEKTVFGQELFDCAITVPFFLVVRKFTGNQ